MLRTSTIRRFSFINSRAHEGRDTPPGNGRRTATQFQLTRPRGARHFVFAPGPILKPFQLTRPRGARLAVGGGAVASADVSTHAPARGATPAEVPLRHHLLVSTHAPARGATPGLALVQGRVYVSTHAPARGATRSGVRVVFGDAVSTHAPARGATRHWYPQGVGAHSFNSRAREGRDLVGSSVIFRAASFNSRAREGRDPLRRRIRPQEGVSTHAPARGATRARRPAKNGAEVSTHAPARGATDWSVISPLEEVFKLTRPRGARRNHIPSRPAVRGFNSRAREGRDPSASRATTAVAVSTHAPARGATRSPQSPP